MNEKTCIGNIDDPNCAQPVVWRRSTQFAGDHYFCDAHARREKDFGTIDPTGGQYVWYLLDPVTQIAVPVDKSFNRDGFTMNVDKPFSVVQFMNAAKAAGHDALGIANDPEALAALDAVKNAPVSLAAASKARELVNAPVNHYTRAPHQPNDATIVEGVYDPSVLARVAYKIELVRNQPGYVTLYLTINGLTCGVIPFDNLVKAATRIDPDHTVGTEAQIQKLRREAAEARAKMYDWQARAMQLEEKLRAFEEAAKA